MRAQRLTLALFLALPMVADASQIAVGLQWQHNVFVQEFWQDGKARYAIFNARPGAIKLTVNDVQFIARPGTESFVAVDGKDLATWEIKSKQVMFVDAPKAPAADGLRYLRFRIEGARLGVLSMPVAPAELPKGKIVSTDGINGSGGRRADVSYEQDALTFKSGGAIEVKLKLPANGDIITFKKKASLTNPTEALIAAAECATLPIEAGAEQIMINTNTPLKAAPIHLVTLRFQAPKVDAPTMVALDGWVSMRPMLPGVAGGSYHVVRGVVVVPEK